MKKASAALATLCAALALLTLFSCSRKQPGPEPAGPDPQIISAFTAGIISRTSTVKVVFTDHMIGTDRIEGEVEPSPLSFSPKVRGTAQWTDQRTLEFFPDQELKPGAEYTATLDLEQVLADRPGGDTDASGGTGRNKPGDFTFTFTVMQQSFRITLDGLHTPDISNLERQVLNGTVYTADAASQENVQEMLTARQGGRYLDVAWEHADIRTHHFTVRDIVRSETPQLITLEWNGRSIGVKEEGSRSLEPVPLGDFNVVETTTVQQEEEYLLVRFSDPLDPEQDLHGLVWSEEVQEPGFQIEGSELRVYTAQAWPPELVLHIEPGIVNSMGTELAEGIITELAFEVQDPQVRFPGRGVILPTTQGVTIPIETINLTGVVVEAVRIYGDNMAQFLQINTLEDAGELRRVGERVWRRELSIGFTPADRNRWVRTGLDLSGLTASNPQGMLRLILSFTRDQIAYNCTDTYEVPAGAQAILDSLEQDEYSSWDYWDLWELEYSFPEYYNGRFNPCHPAFYQKFYDHDIRVARNLLVSDIGLIARQDRDGLTVTASDLKTAKPLEGVEISVLNFQQNHIGNGRTGQQGMAVIDPQGEPFLLVARKDDQAGYLKLDDGAALAVSHFDVGGTESQEGLRGFLYGDRGVWRPGDPIYLTFILMDEENRLPAGHPVELRLLDPRGRLVETVTARESTGGFHHFPLATGPDAPTGSWTAQVRVGGAEFTKTLSIETVRPNRLKIDLDFGSAEALSGSSIEADLHAEWLHGAPAPGLHTEVEVAFSSRATRFGTFGDYAFDDPAAAPASGQQLLYEGTLDEQGSARVSGNVYVEGGPPGMLQARFVTRVFEPGGAASTDRFSMPFHPYEQYVGVKTPKGDEARGMLLTDTDHTAQIALVDTEGRPVEKGRVRAELYQINWRWWWETGEEDLPGFFSSSDLTPLSSDEIPIRGGSGTWEFRVEYPSWGRYLVRVTDLEGGHTTGKIVYIDWPGWAGRAQADAPGGATVLPFTADKERYQVGEWVNLTIPSGSGGRVLVSIEAGGRLVKSEWLETSEESTAYRFQATGDMAPNCYVHAHLVQPHLQTQNDLPIRLYGIIPVMVEDEETRLHPVIESADVFRPQESAAVTVREQSGRPMTYTLAVVDEGLLGLTRFKTPDPWAHFYSRQTTAVRTWDLYDLVAAAYGGVLEQLLAVGGGGEEQAAQGAKANRFPPLVRFLGPFQLQQGGRGEHTIDIPQYLGAVRLMCVAGHGEAFGSASREVTVKKPLMVLGTLPRVLSTEEEVAVPVSVFVLDENMRSVTVSARVSGPVALSGPDRIKLDFSRTGDKLATFRLKAGSSPGIGSVALTASSGGEKAEHTIEFDVRVPADPVVSVYGSELDPGRTWREHIPLPGIAGSNRFTLEVSRIPPLNLEQRLQYLVRYPHGCLEQVTSAAFGQLFLPALVKLDPERAENTQRNVEAAIGRIAGFQTGDGGFSLWPGGGQAQAWVTSYAGHFMVEAGKQGYLVQGEVLDNWAGHQLAQSYSWTAGPDTSELEQSYRLYTLALAGQPALGAMNRLRAMPGLSDAARWQLGAAYALAGQKETADELTGRPPRFKAYREADGTFGSGFRDQALVLEASVLAGRMDRARGLVEELSNVLGGDQWLSTQETGYALLAIARYAGVSGGAGSAGSGASSSAGSDSGGAGSAGEQAGALTFDYNWNGRKESVSGQGPPVVQIELPAPAAEGGDLTVTSNSGITLYPRLIAEGTPPPGRESAAANGLWLDVSYQDLDQNPLDPAELVQGTDFMAAVTVRAQEGAGRQLALSHLVPSGWEIRNLRLDGTELPGSSYQYQDLRDDRVYTYFDLNAGEVKTFYVRLNASYAGIFYLPLVQVEAMYDRTLQARVPGRWVEVTVPGGAE
jgi:hypothetical protein